MTVSTTQNRVSFTGNGVTTAFSFPFPLSAATDMRVYVDGVLQTVDASYTLSTPDDLSYATVNFSAPPANGSGVVVLRDTDLRQSTGLPANGSLPSESLENALDKLTLQNQRVADLSQRAVRLADSDITSPSLILPAASVRASTLLGFDSSGLLAAYPSIDAGLSSITAMGSTTSRTLQERFTDHYNLKDWASLAVGNDWTNAINTAIETISSKGGTYGGFGVLDMPPGVFMASRVEVKRGVMLSSQSQGSNFLLQLPGSNQDFLISENFHALTNSNRYAPTNTDVPYWFGLHNMHISGNFSGGNTSGRGVCFYGNGQVMSGINYIEDTAQSALHTEAAGAATLTNWRGQEEGFFGTLIIKQGESGNGWKCLGPHDFSSLNTLIMLNANSSDYGFYNENTPNYKGLSDNVGQIHVYSGNTNLTNRRGMYFGSQIVADFLMGDACSIVFADTGVGEGHSFVDRIYLGNVGKAVNYDGLTVLDDQVIINSLFAATMVGTGAAGSKVINWSGAFGVLGNAIVYNNGSDYDGASFTGGNTRVNNIGIYGFNGTGRKGLILSGSYNNIKASIQNCKTAIDYTPGGHNDVSAEIYLSAGQTPVSGTFGASDRTDIQWSGDANGALHNRRGTMAGDDAVAGCVGEYKESLQSSYANFPTSGQYGGNISITLTAGDWDLHAISTLYTNGATITNWYAGFGTVTGNDASGIVPGDNFTAAPAAVGGESSVVIPIYRVPVASTTTYYFKVKSTYAGGPPQYKARISARRMR